MSSTKIDCFDLSLIIDRLTELRKSDDRVILELNDSLPTRSFDANNKICRQRCEQFDIALGQLKEERSRIIRDCLVENEKKLRLVDSQGGEIRPVRQAIRFLKNEQTVEDIVAERTKKAVHDRCKGVF